MSLADQIYEHAKRLPADAASEVLDFMGYLESKLQRRETQITSKTYRTSRRQPGSAKDDLLYMADDFEAPLEDFNEYLT